MAPDTLEAVRREVDDFRYTDYLRALPGVQDADTQRKPLRVAVLRSYTLEPIEPVLRLRLLLDGFEPEFWIGDYNQYNQEVLDPGSRLYDFDPDLVFLMVRIEELLPDFVNDFASEPPEHWAREASKAADTLAHLARKVAADASATVIVQNASLAHEPFLGAFDAQTADGQLHLVNELNRRLTGATSVPGVFVWDFDAFVRRHGRAQLFDPKTWYVSRNPFAQSAYPALAADLMRYVRSALGLVKKCVAVDLDNTLWGGIVGEEGIEGIQLGDDYPGNCYKEFQRRLLRLYHRGVLLAINSKNNEADALQAIDEHPDMILRREHFAAMRINWRDKAANLRELASELNIGLDSFLFLDDNPVECELVRQQCPEVDVVRVPERPYRVPDVVSRLRGVDNVRLTDEDRRKGEMYQAQAARRAHEDSFEGTDLEEFLQSLEMEVAIEPASDFSIPRIAQLTQKTNQMNVTTRRYSEADIRSFAEGEDSVVCSVAAKDRFGDHGIIGVLILVLEGSDMRIDTFLMSCRVIGRGIEGTVLDYAEQHARERGAEKLVGEFIPTAKNAPAEGLFEGAGFEAGGRGLYQRRL